MDLTRAPLHNQIKEILREKIKNGEYKDKLPGEFALMEEFSVSRTTIREALTGLVQEGLLVKYHGKGTFVTNKPIYDWLGVLSGFSETMKQMGFNPSAKVIRIDLINDKKIGGILSTESIYVIERLRLIEEIPIAIETNYFPSKIGIQLKGKEEETFYNILEDELGLILDHAEETISAIAADEREAELLQIDPGSPLIKINRTTYTIKGEPLEFLKAVYRSDYYNFKINLKRNR